MFDFERKMAYGFVIEKVNLSRATIKEAQEFKVLFDEDISRGHTIIFVDFTAVQNKFGIN
jgi:hypothetical protein